MGPDKRKRCQRGYVKIGKEIGHEGFETRFYGGKKGKNKGKIRGNKGKIREIWIIKVKGKLYGNLVGGYLM